MTMRFSRLSAVALFALSAVVIARTALATALVGSFSPVTAGTALDLTAEGTLDWAHWGLVSTNSFDHKNGVTQKISDFTVLGTQAVQQYADNFTAYSWTDGAPTPS